MVSISPDLSVGHPVEKAVWDGNGEWYWWNLPELHPRIFPFLPNVPHPWDQHGQGQPMDAEWLREQKSLQGTVPGAAWQRKPFPTDIYILGGLRVS